MSAVHRDREQGDGGSAEAWEAFAAASGTPGAVGELGRLYPVVAFEWLGTAVPDFHGDASAVRSRVERLTALGVDVAVLSAGSVQALDAQLHARPGVEGRLFLLVAAGSETYVVGPRGPRLMQRRRATADEERKLDELAVRLCDELVARGLIAQVEEGHVYHRVIDVMPEVDRGDENDPSQRVAVERQAAERLRAAGLGEHGDIGALAARLAVAAGLGKVRVTAESGRIVIGLTDEADSIRWVARYLLHERGRETSDLLVCAAEFGSRDGGPGRDAVLLVPELVRSQYVSVGAERHGVPGAVLHLGGGPDALLRILDAQIDLRERVARQGFPEPTADAAWLFRVDGFDPFREREVETWMTVANGETGTRGSIEEGSAASSPATYVAGVFGDSTVEPRIRQPVPAPDWLCLRLLVHGTPLNLANGEILEHARILDMRQGLVFRLWRQRDRLGREVQLRTARFASLSERHVLAVRAEATPENFCGQLTWEGCLGITHAGGPTTNAAVESLDGEGFVARTRGRRGGGHGLAVATAPAPGSPVSRRLEMYRDVIGGRLETGEPATVDRFAAVVASQRQVPPESRALRLLDEARETGYDELLRRHREAWEARWRDADVAIEGDAHAQLAVRFAVYHMISTADPSNANVSVGARGLSGMSYFGHVFWDTEIFVVPFFIYSHPPTARALLAYRYNRLDMARRKAQRFGHRGALFPWESADSGDETTPPYGLGPDGEIIPILSGILEHHISADVAWATWEYWKVTGDDEFMLAMGAEMILETARFWVSRASHDDEGHHHIRLVVGPDEYHESVDDNAYTNVLARWNIRRALESLAWLAERDPRRASELRRKLRLSEKELRDWRLVAEDMVDGFDPETKLYEQFAGFFELDDIEPERLTPRPMPADLILGREVVQHAKVIKQADVVMMNYVLSDEVSQEVTAANFDYYEPITVHGSSLSPAIHAGVAARLGKMEAAVDSYRLAADVDLSDNMGNAARGLHMATMGGLWQATVMGFGGVRRHGETLVLHPHLPEHWRSLRFPLRFRGARLDVWTDGQTLKVEVEDAPVTVAVGRSAAARLEPGAHTYVRGRRGIWKETP